MHQFAYYVTNSFRFSFSQWTIGDCLFSPSHWFSIAVMRQIETTVFYTKRVRHAIKRLQNMISFPVKAICVTTLFISFRLNASVRIRQLFAIDFGTSEVRKT